MALANKISLKILNPNAASGGVESYTVYRAAFSDPCPNGVPDTNLPGYYTTTITPSSGTDSEFTFIDEDANLQAGSSYFYRFEFTRGAKSIMSSSPTGPCFTLTENSLGYTKSTTINDTNLTDYFVSSSPLFHFSADQEYSIKGTAVGTAFASGKNMTNFSLVSEGMYMYPNSSTVYHGLDDWTTDPSFKVFRPHDDSVFSGSFAQLFNWDASGEHYSKKILRNLTTYNSTVKDRIAEPTGYDFSSNSSWYNLYGSQKGNHNNPAFTRSNLVMDEGMTLVVVYSTSGYQHQTLSYTNPVGFHGRYAADGTQDNAAHADPYYHFEFGRLSNHQPGQYILTKYSTGDRWLTSPNSPEFPHSPEFTAENPPGDTVIPEGYVGGGWSTRSAFFGTYNANGYVNGAAKAAGWLSSEEANKFNLFIGQVDADTATRYIINGIEEQSRTQDLMGRYSTSALWSGTTLDAFYGNTSFESNHGATFNFNNIPYFGMRGYQNFRIQFPFSEMLFFPSKLSVSDINIIQNYYSNKYGAHFATQTPYTV